MTDLVVGQLVRETLDIGGNSLHVGLVVRETLMQKYLPPTDLQIGLTARETLLRQPIVPTELGIAFVARETLLVPQEYLKLVSLYPMAPSDVYAFSNSSGADFPDPFSQFSLSLWCCEFVNLRGPNGVNAPYGFDLRFSPSTAYIEFRDANNIVLFSGTFTNPGVVTKTYHVMLSIDTMAQVYTFWVSGVQWPTTDAAFGSPGTISNEAG